MKPPVVEINEPTVTFADLIKAVPRGWRNARVGYTDAGMLHPVRVFMIHNPDGTRAIGFNKGNVRIQP